MKKGFKDIEIYRERLSHYLSSIGQKTDPNEGIGESFYAV